MIAKQVRNDRDQDPDPGEQQEELEDEEEKFPKVDVCDRDDLDDLRFWTDAAETRRAF